MGAGAVCVCPDWLLARIQNGRWVIEIQVIHMFLVAKPGITECENIVGFLIITGGC